jgi:hypothetical protein
MNVVNKKAIQAANFLSSVYLLIMLDTLLLRPSLHFATLHPPTLHFTSRHLINNTTYLATYNTDSTAPHS